MISDAIVKKSLYLFLEGYNPIEHDIYWQKKSRFFHDFWDNKIRNKDYILSTDDIDVLVRVIDDKALGHNKLDESIGRVGIYQSLWRKAINALKDNQKLQDCFNNIVKAQNDIDLLLSIEKFFVTNKNNKNGLNGDGANMINSFLFLKNPNKFLSVLALKHRSWIMEVFGLGDFNAYKTKGERIVKSSYDILNNFNKAYDTNLSPRTLSEFLYTPFGNHRSQIRQLWYQGSAFKYHKKVGIDAVDEIKMSEFDPTKIINRENNFQGQGECTNIYSPEQYAEQKRIGDKGERIVKDAEKKRLISCGRKDLSNKVRIVSRDYSLGYDVKSYDKDGDIRCIEVKSTTDSIGHNYFFLSENELTKSKELDNYYIYLVYSVDSKPFIKTIENPKFDDGDSFKLTPKEYLVEPLKKAK